MNLARRRTYNKILRKPFRFLLHDDFVDMDGTLLETHTPSIGGSWIARVGEIEINTNAIRGKLLAVDGNEILTNVEYTTNTTGWTAGGGSTLTRRDFTTSPNISPTGGSDDFGLEVKSNGGVNSDGEEVKSSSIAGLTYLASCRAYAPSANVTSRPLYMTVYENGGSYLTKTDQRIVAEDGWETLSGSFQLLNQYPLLYKLRCASANSGDLAYFDKASLQASIGLYTTDIETANSDLRLEITTPVSGVAPMGIIVRYKDPSNYWMWLIKPGTSGNDLLLYKFQSGVFTLMTSADIDWAANTTYSLRFTTSFHEYTAYVAGVSQASYVDAIGFLESETEVGIMFGAVNNFKVNTMTALPISTSHAISTSHIDVGIIRGGSTNRAIFNGATSSMDIYTTLLGKYFYGARCTMMVRAKAANSSVWNTHCDLIRIDGDGDGTVGGNDKIVAIDIEPAVQAGEVRAFYRGGSDDLNNTRVSSSLLGSLEWFDTAVTVDLEAGRLRGYVNGTQQGADVPIANAWAGTINSTTHNAAIGTAYIPATQYIWNGNIGPVMVLCREATPSEMLSIHNDFTLTNAQVLFGPYLIAWYELDET